MKIYKRENYLKKIRGFYHDSETIKVITGIRRCGKSYLLEMIKNELIESGIKQTNIIDIQLDKRPYKKIKTSKNLGYLGKNNHVKKYFALFIIKLYRLLIATTSLGLILLGWPGSITIFFAILFPPIINYDKSLFLLLFFILKEFT